MKSIPTHQLPFPKLNFSNITKNPPSHTTPTFTSYHSISSKDSHNPTDNSSLNNYTFRNISSSSRNRNHHQLLINSERQINQSIYNQKPSRNAFIPLPSSAKSYQLNSSRSATARSGSKGNCLAKVPSGLNNEIEFMDIKLKCELISHKLSKLKNIVLPITDTNIKKFRTRNYNFEHITFHARTPLNYGKGYNGVNHGKCNTFDVDLNMMYQNKSELTKDNNNKRNDHEDGDNLSDIADNIVDAFEIEGGDKGNEGGSKSKVIDKEESINIQDGCDLNGSEKKMDKNNKEKSSSKKKKKIKKKVIKKVKKVKEHINENGNENKEGNNNEDIEEEIEEEVEVEVEETEEEEDEDEVNIESDDDDNENNENKSEKGLLRSRKKKKISKDNQEEANEDNNTKANEIDPNTNIDKQNSPQEEDTDGIISQIIKTAYANTDPKQLNNPNNQIKTDLININEYNEENYNHPQIYKSVQQPTKKGVSFSDESTVKIQYKDTDIITKLEIYDINENKLPFKPRNINRYLTLLMSEQEEDFPKPCILNSGDNSLLYSSLKTHVKSSAAKKKILQSLNQKNMIRKNIEMIQEISKRKSIYNIKAPNKRKGIKKPNCKKFRDNPQHFFTETLCERMIYAYDLKIEDIKDENEVKRLGKSHSPNKVRHFNVHEETNDFSEDKSKVKDNVKQSKGEVEFKKNIANIKINDAIKEDENENNCGDSNKKENMGSERKHSL